MTVEEALDFEGKPFRAENEHVVIRFDKGHGYYIAERVLDELKYSDNKVFIDEEVFEFHVMVDGEAVGFVRGNNRSHAHKRSIQALARKKLNEHLNEVDIQSKYMVDFERELEEVELVG